MGRLLSTRLFPKNQGATRYEITGLAARCDWVILSDSRPPHIDLRRTRECNRPRHIFLSLRAPFEAIRFFVETVLPQLDSDFILITGSEDITLPRQTDARWRRFTEDEQGMLDAILHHPHLVHWYAENLDQSGDPKRSPIPLGLVFPAGDAAEVDPLLQVPHLSSRTMHVFCAHRMHTGPQWETRRRVSALAQGPWRDFCTVAETELPEPAFMAALTRHRFVLCVGGGGIDPAPKTWSALLHGAIPVISRNALLPAYAHLPVVIVDGWDTGTLSLARLCEWQEALSPWFDHPGSRSEILLRLTEDYWWAFIHDGIPITMATADSGPEGGRRGPPAVMGMTLTIPQHGLTLPHGER